MTKRTKIVDDVIRTRRTTKAYSDEPVGHPIDPRIVNELIDIAGWAPFHRTAAKIHTEGTELNSPVPWRFYVLDAIRCHRLREQLLAQGDESKVPRMLAVAAALIQVTWLPNPPKDPLVGLFEPTVQNMEHIAATAAAIQNLLIAASAREIPTYWSSGGAMRNQEAFAWMGIPEREILLGSVYLFPTDLSNKETASGNLREMRGDAASWSRWVE